MRNDDVRAACIPRRTDARSGVAYGSPSRERGAWRDAQLVRHPGATPGDLLALSPLVETRLLIGDRVIATQVRVSGRREDAVRADALLQRFTGSMGPTVVFHHRHGAK